MASEVLKAFQYPVAAENLGMGRGILVKVDRTPRQEKSVVEDAATNDEYNKANRAECLRCPLRDGSLGVKCTMPDWQHYDVLDNFNGTEALITKATPSTHLSEQDVRQTLAQALCHPILPQLIFSL